MPGIQLVCQRAEQGGLRGGLVYHNNLQVFNHKDTKTCRYIKAIYILICWLLGVKAHSKGRLTKITGKTGEVLTSPKKDMYIMHGWEGKNKNM